MKKSAAFSIMSAAIASLTACGASTPATDAHTGSASATAASGPADSSEPTLAEKHGCNAEMGCNGKMQMGQSAKPPAGSASASSATKK